MLFRLVIPYVDRTVEEGIITKWHKREGEWVNYGDDVFDLQIDEIKFLNRTHSALRIFKNRITRKFSRRTRVSVVRFTASDAGYLREVYAKAGERRSVGDLLAVLSTEEGEPIDNTSASFKDTTEFRLVSNITYLWSGSQVE